MQALDADIRNASIAETLIYEMTSVMPSMAELALKKKKMDLWKLTICLSWTE